MGGFAFRGIDRQLAFSHKRRAQGPRDAMKSVHECIFRRHATSVLTHPEGRWYFLYNPDFQENPEKKKHEDERYEVRLATLRTMASAYQNGGYHIGTDGTSVRIVDGIFSRVIV